MDGSVVGAKPPAGNGDVSGADDVSGAEPPADSSGDKPPDEGGAVEPAPKSCLLDCFFGMASESKTLQGKAKESKANGRKAKLETSGYGLYYYIIVFITVWLLLLR